MALLEFSRHNRPIARSVADSVVRVILGREMVLRGGVGMHAFYPPDRDVGLDLALGHAKDHYRRAHRQRCGDQPACR
jgi:hydrogenase maturation factor HypF (carbamoyltransferase family)